MVQKTEPLIHVSGFLAVREEGHENHIHFRDLNISHRRQIPKRRHMPSLLAIAAHIPSAEIGADYFQAAHPERLFKAF